MHSTTREHAHASYTEAVKTVRAQSLKLSPALVFDRHPTLTAATVYRYHHNYAICTDVIAGLALAIGPQVWGPSSGISPQNADRIKPGSRNSTYMHAAMNYTQVPIICLQACNTHIL